MASLAQPQSLTDQERMVLEEEFQSVFSFAEQREKLFLSLDEFFSDPNNRKYDQVYEHDYFRWYSELTWKNIQALSPERFISLAIDRQIYKAIQLGYKPYNILMYYLELNSVDEEEMNNLYEKIKTALFSATCVIGTDSKTGETLTLADLLKKLQQFEQQGTLEKAEFYTGLSRIISIPDQYKEFYTLSTPDQIVERVQGLFNFFQGVKRDTIFYIVNAFLHPNLFNQKQSDFEINTVDESQELTDEEIIALETISYEDIKLLVNTKFQKDENGQYQDIEGVFSYLETLSKEYNDERIQGLLYFDENTGNFVWTKEEDVPVAKKKDADASDAPSNEHEIPPEFFDEPNHS